MPVEYENEEEAPERQITPEEFLLLQKGSIRKKSLWAIGIGAFFVLVPLLWLSLFAVLGLQTDFSLLFRNISFLLGLFAVAGGVWGIYYAKNLTLEDLIPSPEAIAFLQQGRDAKNTYSYILVGLLAAVTVVQLLTEQNESLFDFGSYSARIAGLEKALVWQGEWWRILTAATLHGIFPFHLYFNAQALYGFGSLIEFLSNRAHLAIVFLLSVIGGSVLSLFNLGQEASIGASGGIMGLIGYLAVYGHRRKKQLPPDFLKSMLINIGFITAFGIVAYQIVDNFGHLGGLLTGALYGFFQIPRDLQKNPRQTGSFTKIVGFAALGIFVLTSIFSVLLLLKIVSF